MAPNIKMTENYYKTHVCFHFLANRVLAFEKSKFDEFLKSKNLKFKESCDYNQWMDALKSIGRNENRVWFSDIPSTTAEVASIFASSDEYDNLDAQQIIQILMNCTLFSYKDLSSSSGLLNKVKEIRNITSHQSGENEMPELADDSMNMCFDTMLQLLTILKDKGMDRGDELCKMFNEMKTAGFVDAFNNICHFGPFSAMDYTNIPDGRKDGFVYYLNEVVRSDKMAAHRPDSSTEDPLTHQWPPKYANSDDLMKQLLDSIAEGLHVSLAQTNVTETKVTETKVTETKVTKNAIVKIGANKEPNGKDSSHLFSLKRNAPAAIEYDESAPKKLKQPVNRKSMQKESNSDRLEDTDGGSVSRDDREQQRPAAYDVTEKEFRELVKHLGTEWEQLATQLGTSSAEIRNLRNQVGITDIMFDMLIEWRDKQPLDSNLCQVLRDALIAVGLQMVAESIFPSGHPKDVTETEFRQLVKQLGKEWEQLATELNITAAEIRRRRNHVEIANKMFDMLINWRDRQPLNTNLCQVLRDALIAVGLQMVADRMFPSGHPKDVTETEFRQLVEHLGPEWEQLATRLGTTAPKIQQLERNIPNVMFDMLSNWKDRQSLETNLRQVLRGALIEVGQQRVADIMFPSGRP